MKPLLAILAILQLSLTGCGRIGIGFGHSDSEPIVPEAGDGYLMFDLQPLEITASRQKFGCAFHAEGKTARFQFELIPRGASEDPSVAIASGRILAVPGSDASVFLRKLQVALEAKTFPTQVKRVSELPFTAAILGTHQSHAANGGFFVKPPGNWTAMKIFIGNEDSSSEVFLNFNPVLGKGEFSMKDPDYGDELLRELAGVL